MIKLKDLLKEGMFPSSFDRHEIGNCIISIKYATQYFLSKGIKSFKIQAGVINFLAPENSNITYE